ncbi:M23 family metallopeptidase [Streptomyces albogriseolus]|uniref:M23 family metallopeptidase n=1 Tax=Streptomyces albogriseolus TaxID=1887 RepID=UPI0034615A83
MVERQRRSYGQWIGLAAANGHVHTYCHLSQRQVMAGQHVTAGQRLGAVGSTGNSTGRTCASRCPRAPPGPTAMSPGPAGEGGEEPAMTHHTPHPSPKNPM